MTDTSHFYFQSYQEWRTAITDRCKIELTPDYARARIAALRDDGDTTSGRTITISAIGRPNLKKGTSDDPIDCSP